MVRVAANSTKEKSYSSYTHNRNRIAGKSHLPASNLLDYNSTN